MTDPRTARAEEEVQRFLGTVDDETRRCEAKILIELMARITGARPAMWGPIIGFGAQRFRDAAGHNTMWYVIGFAPRRSGLALYLMDGLSQHEKLLAELGTFSITSQYLSIDHLEDIDFAVLEQLIRRSVAAVRGGGNSVQPETEW